MSTPALAWLLSYSEHLEQGAERLRAGDPLTREFAERCQELDASVRQLGGDALRAAGRSPGGHELIARLEAARTAFEEAAALGVESLQTRRGRITATRRGLKGYGATGQWLSASRGRYIERSA